MSRPLVILPRSAACTAALADRIELATAADAPERFDVLGYGGPAEAVLRLAAEREDAVGALVLTAPTLPADPAIIARCATLGMPALVVFGTRDPAMPADAARRWRALLPGCHFMLVYDAGQDVAADRPRAFADLVLDFLANPTAFLVNRRDGAIDR